MGGADEPPLKKGIQLCINCTYFIVGTRGFVMNKSE